MPEARHWAATTAKPHVDVDQKQIDALLREFEGDAAADAGGGAGDEGSFAAKLVHSTKQKVES